MITIVPCTSSDCAAVTDLWNAKRLDPQSCWYQADTVDEAYVNGLLSAGIEISIAKQDGSPVGFGVWCGTASAPKLVAVAADDDEIYYRLLGEFCDWGIALGAQGGYAEIGTAATTERGRMDALGVIDLVAIGPTAPRCKAILPGLESTSMSKTSAMVTAVALESSS